MAGSERTGRMVIRCHPGAAFLADAIAEAFPPSETKIDDSLEPGAIAIELHLPDGSYIELPRRGPVDWPPA